MIARVADNCFWFGRYVERAESTARLLQVTRALSFDAEISVAQCWQPVVIVSGEYPAFVKRFSAEQAGDASVVQEYTTWDHDNHISLWSTIRAARESARTVRDVISGEVWEEINELYLWMAQPEARAEYERNRDEFYRRVRRAGQLCLGLARSTMLREPPLAFLWLGTMLERSAQTARILDMHHHTLSGENPHKIVDLNLWLALLRACSGYEAFMRRCRGQVSRSGVLDFLLFEASFPRSIRYCTKVARGLVTELFPGAAKEPGSPGFAAYKRIDELNRWLDERRSPGLRHGIHELLTHVVDESGDICGVLSRDMMGPQAVPTQMQSQ